METAALWEHMDADERRAVQAWRAWPTRKMYVLRDQSGVVAAVYANVLDAHDSCNIDLVFVRPDARRRGHGAHLVRHVLGLGRAACYATPWEDTDAFWTAQGFAPGVFPAELAGAPGVDAMWGRRQ